MKKKLSTKLNGKWWTFGSLATNQWGKEQVSMRVTKELKNLVNEKQEGDWLNFSLFDDDGVKKDKPIHDAKKSEDDFGDSEIPF